VGVAPRALVTGANGFLGSHLVDLLLARGYAVRCLVRRTSDLRWLPRERVEFAYAGLEDAAGLTAAVSDVATVFHVAGVIYAPDDAGYLRVNRDGARRLVEAANTARVGRFVLVSSMAAGGPSRPGRPNREDDPPAPVGAYGRSKLAGEEAVREAARIPWTVVRPAAVYGARDAEFLKLYRMVKRGFVPEVPGGQEIALVEARDLAAGMLAAAEAESAAGKVYYLTHPEAVSWRGLGEIVAGALGRRYRSVPVPAALLSPVAHLIGFGARVTGRPNPFPADRVADLTAPAWTCSPEQAARDFGFAPRHDAVHGVPEAVRWCKEQGWL